MADIETPLAGSGTRQGKARTHNEDYLGMPPTWAEPALLERKGRLYVVADGMGGHQAGEEASRRAVARIIHEYYIDVSADVPASLERAIRLANMEVYREALRSPALRGMGTTVTAAVVRGSDLFVANVGDSRAYLIRGGRAHQITKDHSWVEEQVRQGLLSPEQARAHPQRNVITRSLGPLPDVQVDRFHVELTPGDRILLCSDGLSNVVRDDDLAAVLSDWDDPADAAEELLEVADRTQRPDDATAVVVHIPGPVTAGPAPVAPKRLWVPLAISGALLVGMLALFGVFLLWERGWFARPTPLPAVDGPVPVAAQATATATLAGRPATTGEPTPSPTAGPTLVPAPALAVPMPEAEVSGESITFSWTWVGDLQPDDYFALSILKDGRPLQWIWTQQRWHGYPTSELAEGTYSWSVMVIRYTGDAADGTRQWEPVSEESAGWTFSFVVPEPTPTSTGTPTPTETLTPAPTETATGTPTATDTAVPTAAATAESQPTATATPTATSTQTPTSTTTATPTATATESTPAP